MYIYSLNIFFVFVAIFFTACGDEIKSLDTNVSKNISSKQISKKESENNKTIPQKIDKETLQPELQLDEEIIEQSEDTNSNLTEEETLDSVPLPKSEEELADEKSPPPTVVEDEVYEGPIPQKSEEERLDEETQGQENITNQKSEEELADEQSSKKED